MRFIQELQDKEMINEHYLCRQKQSAKTKSGKDYYALKLQDKTGIIDAKIWKITNEIEDFEEGEIVQIDGFVQTFQNDLQIVVNSLRRSCEGEYKLRDYIPRTDKDRKVLYNQVKEFIASIEDYHIKTLMENILINNKEIVQAFYNHTAAKNMHHNYLGGLLEHTVAVVQICDFMSGRYRHINRDLLIATALLHDIGKIYELSKLPVNDYTDDGQMLGHIVMGVELVTAEAAKISDFPHELASLIKHSILSHHGEMIYGSPKLPNTIEAFILHCADNMDAKLKAYEETLDKMVKDAAPGPWAGYHRMLERFVRKSDFI